MSELSLAVSGELSLYFKKINAAVDQGVRAGLRRTTFGMRNGIRTRIRRSGGFKTNFARLVVASVKGRGLDAVGTVRSVATYDKGNRAQPVDLVTLFSQGATLRAAKGKWLAIPTGHGPLKPGGRGRSRYATPSEALSLGNQLTFIPAGNGRAVLVNKARNVVTHVLIRQATLRKRYDLDPYVQRWVPRFPQILAEEVDKAYETTPGLKQLDARISG